MQVYVIYLIVLILGFFVLPLVIHLLLIPSFWVFVACVIVFIFIIRWIEKKEKGYLMDALAYVQADGVDFSKYSRLLLYPDKFTVNDIQTIPTKNIIKAVSETKAYAVRGNYGRAKNYRHMLVIYFTNKDEKEDYITCYSKVTQTSFSNDFNDIEKKINEMVGYQHEVKKYPTNPYQL